MNLALASLSDNLVNAATGVMALAMLAHAGAWAFTRERRSAALAARRLAARGSASAATATTSGGATPSTDPAVAVAVLDRPAVDADAADGSEVVTSTGTGAGDHTVEEARAYRSDVFQRIGVALTILATLLLGAGVLTRGLAADRVPWSNLYEFAISGAFVVAVGYLAMLRPLRLGFLGLPVTGFLLVVLGIAVAVLYTPVSGLIPALQSYWLAIHVSAAVLSTGVFTIAAIASLLQILKARQERRAVDGASGGYLAQLPSAAALERIAYRLNAFAFPVWTFALIAGAIWAAAAWGRYWGWDPKETWMFITWVCYAAYLHARATAGWRDKVAWIGLVAYGAVLFNLIGVNFLLPGLHSYTGM